MADKTYEDGLRDGQIQALENMMQEHKGRLDNHAKRLALLERIMWALIGVGVLIEIFPKVQTFFGSL